jgi:hypothetical protein
MVRPVGSFEPAPADGRTEVTFLCVHPNGVAKLVRSMVARTMRSEVAQLDRL